MAYSLNFTPVLDRFPELVDGAKDTIILSGESIAIGLVIGLSVALVRINGPKWSRASATAYVEAFRNTPMLVQLFLLFFGLPYIGFRIDANTAAVIAISVNLGAYSAEIFRAGLLAIPRTQIEAGLALGLSLLQVMRHVVIVPALKVIYPALTAQLTLTMLGTSLVSAIAANDLTFAGSRIVSQTARSLETFILLAPMYIAITFGFRFIYWLIGLWLFRRRVPASGNVTATLGIGDT